MADSKRDWRELCLAVTNEKNSAKLSSLVQELIEALDNGKGRWHQPLSPPPVIASNVEAA